MTIIPLAAMAVVVSMVCPPAAQADDKALERILNYRQGAMAVIGNNVGVMGAMVKGERPYDQAVFREHAHDLAAMASINLLRGFPEGSEGGRTKAKLDIWLDWADFEEKMGAFQKAAAALGQAAAGGDKDVAFGQFKKTAKTCKSCHKEYKSKNWLNE